MAWIREEDLNIANIIKVMSINPRAMAAVQSFNQELTFGASALTRVQEEAIATTVSVINRVPLLISVPRGVAPSAVGRSGPGQPCDARLRHGGPGPSDPRDAGLRRQPYPRTIVDARVGRPEPSEARSESEYCLTGAAGKPRSLGVNHSCRSSMVSHRCSLNPVTFSTGLGTLGTCG